ncbi:YDG domain-containing protein [Hirschfeldia incana]|nr:YDG domain-containing protein [Hirschfeldia incana]
MDRARKRPIVYAIRDFPPGCGTNPTNFPDKDHFKSSRTGDDVVSDSEPVGASPKEEQKLRTSKHDRVLVRSPKPEETRLKQEPALRSLHDRVLGAPKHKGSCSRQEPESKQSNPDHVVGAPPTPREKVLEVLRAFKDVYRELDRDKQARRGGDAFDATARIDIKAQAFLESEGRHVNAEKRIGLVPGINIGDEFQYKTELRLVGLHFKTMCGIDYMDVGGVKYATSIVASEGNGYDDKFDAGVVIYTGEGGNVISKQEKKTENQRMVKGNLALANSMRHKTEVRVIRGQERYDGKGKRYVYDGLYLVDKYWLEKGVSGKSMYKFKLCKIPGQTR